MKTLKFAKVLCVFVVVAFLSSCYSFKPYLDANQTSPENFSEKIVVGERYEVVLTSGQKFQIKVDSLTEQNMLGRVFYQEKNVRQKDFMIPFSQVASVKNRRFNPVLTIIAIVVPIGVAALLFSNASFGGGSFSI